MAKTLYLGKGRERAPGHAKLMVVMNYTKLSSEPYGHILTLGSVTPELALNLNSEINQRFYKYYKRFENPRELFHKVLSGLKLPRTHEIVLVGDEQSRYSELRVKPSLSVQGIEAIQVEVKKAFREGYPLEFVYDNRPKELENEYGWRSPSRQVEVMAIEAEGFKAVHGRGVRRYRWEKVERAAALTVNGWTLLPELCIEMAIPYEPDNPRQRVDFIVNTVHRMEKDYVLGSAEDLISRPSMRQGLVKTWS